MNVSASGGRAGVNISAPGKLLLFGEHAAVYGYPAVGLSLPLTLTLRCVPADRFSIGMAGTELPHGMAGTEFPPDRGTELPPDRGMELPPDRGMELPPDRARAFQAHLETVIQETPSARLPRERCEIISELPIGGGFGSSAALCTALARKILPPGSATDRVWSVAHRLEHFFHGTPSGIDTGLSCRSGAWAFRFVRDRGSDAPARGGHPGSVDDRSSDTVQKNSRGMEDQARTALELPRAEAVSLPPAVLVAGSIPRETSTRDLVARVRGRHDADPSRYGDILQRLGELSDETARDASRDRSAFALRVDEAQQRLTELGVSSPALERIIATGRAAGATAGKLSGAGGGGAFFLVCPDTQCAEDVRRALGALADTPTALFTVPLE